MPTLYGDDGKGNVAESIAVASDQKFWFKGYADKVGDRIDTWFDEYGNYPPYPYIRSHWLCTVYANAQRYFDTSPYDLCWLHDTGKKNGKGNKIWELHQSKRGLIWTGPIETNIGFKATENNFPSKYATVTPTLSPADLWELRIHFLKLPWANEALGRSILNSLASAVGPIVERFGYKYLKIECNWAESYYSLFFIKTGSPIGMLAAVLAIGAVIAAILAGAGLVLMGLSWWQGSQNREQEITQEKDFISYLNDLLNQGKITAEQYAQLLEAYRKQKGQIEIPWTGLMIVAVALGGIYLLGKAGERKEAKEELV